MFNVDKHFHLFSPNISDKLQERTVAQDLYPMLAKRVDFDLESAKTLKRPYPCLRKTDSPRDTHMADATFDKSLSNLKFNHAENSI